MGLNIQYPYNIDWLPEEGRPFGLFEIMGWIEERVKEIKEERRKQELEQSGYTEHHVSDMSEEE